jgi:hypothetical protein
MGRNGKNGANGTNGPSANLGFEAPRARTSSSAWIGSKPLDGSGQDSIAHTRAMLHAKSESNRRTEATQEEMARALFKTWFVDFDPIRAKMDSHHSRTLADVRNTLLPRLLLGDYRINERSI